MYTPKKAYFYGTGRRKSSVARVRLIPGGSGQITINNREFDNYFGLDTLKTIVKQPLELVGVTGQFDLDVKVQGGGFTGQAGAIRFGVARALLQANEEYRPLLKKAGFLTRDPRMKERKRLLVALPSSPSADLFQAVFKTPKPCGFGVFLYVNTIFAYALQLFSCTESVS